SQYLSQKDIKIVGVPKNVSQAKYTSQLLDKLHAEHPEGLKNTAVVLGDETLLNPLLNSVPEILDRVNITMGYPLNKTPLASFFDQLMALYIQRNKQGWFYRDLLVFLAHPSVHLLLSGTVVKVQSNSADVSSDLAGHITATIKKKNWAYVNAQQLEDIAGREHPTISLLFQSRTPSPKHFIKKVLEIISQLKTKLQQSNNAMDLEYLYRFNGLFNQLDNLVGQHDFITDLLSLRSLYRQLSSFETLDFRGEPLEGLQIMGMLESRNLDFETVIITSVNEGVLPSGKSNNSFIPFDLKVHFGLPTYKEKDAVYTYHFYRLLQRAKNVYILYSTEPDDALGGGERSRLINQLLTDEKRHDIVQIHASPSVEPIPKKLDSIEKDAGLLELIKAHAANGFSPTSLTNYISNPIDFYKRNLLGIDDVMEVEETVAANTFGTIVHDVLEDLYRPFLGGYLTEEGLLLAKKNMELRVRHHFTESYGDGDFSRGKNLIAFNVIVKYIENFLTLEIKQVQQHQIKILALEEKLEVDLDIPELDFPVRLKGKLDRIDEVDGVLRIIDYKTGKVENKNVEIVEWQSITANYDFSKAFQLLCYALMYYSKNPIPKMEAGIFSFKNQGAGVMRFATKPSSRSRTKNYDVTPEIHRLFNNEAKNLVLEICNLAVPFQENEI
ncbi:MAG: PD-(D/E)XK nuclease family protein, partial [Pricia sp.]